MENPNQLEPELESPARLSLEVTLGFLLTFGLHLPQLLLLSFKTGRLIFLFFGVTQLLYVLPAIYLFRQKQKNGLVIGLIFGASLTFLIGLPYVGCGLMYAGIVEMPTFIRLEPL